MLVEFAGKVGNAMSLEVEVVHVDIQTLLVEYIKMLFSVLEEEGGLSDAACTFDADHTVAPVDLVHKGATYWSVDMLDKVSMRPEESFHPA